MSDELHNSAADGDPAQAAAEPDAGHPGATDNAPAAHAQAAPAEHSGHGHAEPVTAASSEPAQGGPTHSDPTPAELADAGAHEAEPAPPAEEEELEDVKPLEEIVQSDEPPKLNWYILKVQSNREDSIREALQRRVNVAGLEKFFSEIIVPTEMVSEFKGGKKRVVKRKLYPGYLVVHMEINEETWFLVRETPGIGDFTGSAGKPSPMSPQEVARIVAKQEEKSAEAPKLKIDVKPSDRVKINEGTFENFEGEVDTIDEASGHVTVMINIFGRSTPVELEYWQIEKV